MFLVISQSRSCWVRSPARASYRRLCICLKTTSRRNMSALSPAVANATSVYFGSWINWNSGSRAAGAILTVSARDGRYLSAFLTLLVTFAEGFAWSILCRTIFLVRASRRPRDALTHQQQAIFRNSATGISALIHLLGMTWAWRNSNRHPVRRTLGFIVVAVLSVTVFVIGGIFVSDITNPSSSIAHLYQGAGKTPSEVLLQGSGSTCGSWTHGEL